MRARYYNLALMPAVVLRALLMYSLYLIQLGCAVLGAVCERAYNGIARALPGWRK